MKKSGGDDNDELFLTRKRMKIYRRMLVEYKESFDFLAEVVNEECDNVIVPDVPCLCKRCFCDVSHVKEDLFCHGRRCIFGKESNVLPCDMCIKVAKSRGIEIELNHCTRCKRRICTKCFTCRECE